MKDALGHGSDAGGLSSGNVSPQAAASMMHSEHVVGGTHDSTYPGNTYGIGHDTLRLIVSNKEASDAVRARGLRVPSQADAARTLRDKYAYSSGELHQLRSGK